MATQADVRRIAPARNRGGQNHFAFSVRNKGKLNRFVWVWKERIAPSKARVPQPKVIAIRVASIFEEDFLVSLDPKQPAPPRRRGAPRRRVFWETSPESFGRFGRAWAVIESVNLEGNLCFPVVRHGG